MSNARKGFYRTEHLDKAMGFSPLLGLVNQGLFLGGGTREKYSISDIKKRWEISILNGRNSMLTDIVNFYMFYTYFIGFVWSSSSFSL